MLSNNFLKKLVIAMMVIGSVSTYAQDAIMKLKQKRPDIIYQMNFSNGSNNFLMMRAADAFEAVKGFDIFDQSIKVPKYEPFIHQNGIGDYIVGEMGKQLEEILLDTLGLDVRGAKTTFDVYDLQYKLTQPRLKLSIEKNQEGSLDVVARIQVRKFTVSADKIYVNNNSPGISVVRHYEAEDNRTQMVFDPETMTEQMRSTDLSQSNIMDYTSLVDDIYLKIQSPSDQPLVVVDGGLAGKDNMKSVIYGELRIGLETIENGGLRLKFKKFDVNLFGAKDGEELSKYIQFNLGQDTKIGSFQGIEYGTASMDMGNKSFLDVVNKKKEMITKLISQPIIDQIFSDDIKLKVEEQINGLVFNPNVTKDLKQYDLSISNSINEIGMLNRDKSKSDNINQLRLGIDIDVKRKGYEDFEFKPTYTPVSNLNYQRSQDILHDKIQNKEETLIISIDQEFLNKAIALNIKGKEGELLTDVPEFLKIGKHGAFLKFDDNKQGKIVIDMLARDKFFMRAAQAIVTGRGKYYFPLVMTPEITIQMRKDIPTLVVKVKNIDTSDETLRNGIFGVPSNLGKGWAKKLVLKITKGELDTTIGTTLLEHPLTDFKGMDLSKLASIKSDGNGRLNLMVNLNAFAQQRLELAKLPSIISNMLKQKSE
jgi:hypothetical protein